MCKQIIGALRLNALARRLHTSFHMAVLQALVFQLPLRWYAVGGALALPVACAAFGLPDVDARARELASAPFQETPANLPSPLQQIAHEKYESIRFAAEPYWQNAKLPFQLQFFHEGWHFDRPVKISEITGESVHEITFDPGLFDFGESGIDPASVRELGFAGFRVTCELNAPGRMDEVLSFLGASYFRALGKGQFYGLSARAVAIDTAAASGEEFPRFVEFWIERPKPDARQLIVYALLDSARITGAYRFVLQPGKDTTIEVTEQLHLRERIDKVGIAPLSSMFFFGANQAPPEEDYRPEVHDSDGLSINAANGEWIWRPLVNPKRLLVSSFQLQDPPGFGLMQRNRAFSHYQDVSARYEAHPSAWIETIGDWGSGRVELVEIPSPDETNDNIVAYWIADARPDLAQPLEFAYRLHWQKQVETRPASAWVAQTRRGEGYPRKRDQATAFVIDYKGPMLAALGDAPDSGSVKADVSADANGEIIENDARRNPVTGGWRVSLRVKQRSADKPVELRARLQRENQESETWSYILPPG